VTYRTGNHWGVTIVREFEAYTAEVLADCAFCCVGGTGCPLHPQPEAQLVAVVVNGDQALAARIAALLTIDERCWHGEHCPGSGPDCERDAPLKGGHRDCAAAWHAEHGCCTEPYDAAASAPEVMERDATTYGDLAAGQRRFVRNDGSVRTEPWDGDAPSGRATSPQAAQNGPAAPSATPDGPGGSEAVHRLTIALTNLVDPDPCGDYDHHGECQTHMATVRGRCAHADARQLLAELDRRADEHTEVCR
jgi:hypothetical protein